MAINFPDTPSLNEQYMVGTRIYVWSGTYWFVQTSGVASSVDASNISGTTLPSNIVNSSLTSTGTLVSGTVDGGSA